MGGLNAPGRDLGGWYGYLPDYNWHTGDAGLAPGHCFGQWTSAMARFAAAQGDAVARARVLRLHQRFAECISPDFFDTTRYPAYTLDKLNIGFLDADTLLRFPDRPGHRRQDAPVRAAQPARLPVRARHHLAEGPGLQLHLGRELHATRKPISAVRSGRR